MTSFENRAAYMCFCRNVGVCMWVKQSMHSSIVCVVNAEIPNRIVGVYCLRCLREISSYVCT